ncbi:MAG: hypothetical protein BWY25_02915 [Chloroflexi bacterium ADurb.Bin222]|nr:MAG: hypothetical protein BWY25_02915 [Chloroflexi bacterium ADurb.Bin222]
MSTLQHDAPGLPGARPQYGPLPARVHQKQAHVVQLKALADDFHRLREQLLHIQNRGRGATHFGRGEQVSRAPFQIAGTVGNARLEVRIRAGQLLSHVVEGLRQDAQFVPAGYRNRCAQLPPPKSLRAGPQLGHRARKAAFDRQGHKPGDQQRRGYHSDDQNEPLLRLRCQFRARGSQLLMTLGHNALDLHADVIAQALGLEFQRGHARGVSCRPRSLDFLNQRRILLQIVQQLPELLLLRWVRQQGLRLGEIVQGSRHIIGGLIGRRNGVAEIPQQVGAGGSHAHRRAQQQALRLRVHLDHLLQLGIEAVMIEDEHRQQNRHQQDQRHKTAKDPLANRQAAQEISHTPTLSNYSDVAASQMAFV